jgi:hypothetical protein
MGRYELSLFGTKNRGETKLGENVTVSRTPSCFICEIIMSISSDTNVQRQSLFGFGTLSGGFS